MDIGIIGSGHIGGVVGKLWARAGHRVLFSSRHPETLDQLVADAGPNASRGTVEQALTFGEVILLSIPYGSVESFGQQYSQKLNGRIAIETGNPYPERDGRVAEEAVRATACNGWVPYNLRVKSDGTG